MNCTILLSCTGCLATEPNLHLSPLLYSCFLLCAILCTSFFPPLLFVNRKKSLNSWDYHLEALLYTSIQSCKLWRCGEFSILLRRVGCAFVCRYYGLPLHLVRELYETFRNFKARVADFIRYRKITSNMNDRFPDATTEELGRYVWIHIIIISSMTMRVTFQFYYRINYMIQPVLRR